MIRCVLRKVDLKEHRLIDTIIGVRDNNCPLILECNTLSESDFYSQDKAYIKTTLGDFPHLLKRLNTPIESDHSARMVVGLRQDFSF